MLNTSYKTVRTVAMPAMPTIDAFGITKEQEQLLLDDIKWDAYFAEKKIAQQREERWKWVSWIVAAVIYLGSVIVARCTNVISTFGLMMWLLVGSFMVGPLVGGLVFWACEGLRCIIGYCKEHLYGIPTRRSEDFWNESDLRNRYGKFQTALEEYCKKKAEYDQYEADMKTFVSKDEVAIFQRVLNQVRAFDLNNMRDARFWRRIGDQQFEVEVGNTYKKLGYDVKVTDYCGDGGVDVILKKDGETTYVQCKHYSVGNYLGVKELREFYGVCMADGIKHGIMVCSSVLSQYAWDFVRKVAPTIEVVLLPDLLRLDNTGVAHIPTIQEQDLPELFAKHLETHQFDAGRFAWLKHRFFYSERAAQTFIDGEIKWPNVSYHIKPVSLYGVGTKQTVYVVLLVPQVAESSIDKLNLSVAL